MASPSEEGALLNRRSYLGIVGAASTAPVLMGQVSADDGPSEDDYDRIVDIAKAGADNTGEELIDDVFDDHAQDDTLIKFPPGTYRANQLNLYGLSNFAMVGEDATLVPGADYNETVWLGGSDVEDLRVENFTLDHSADGVAPEIDINAFDGLTVRNIHKKGFHEGTGVAFHCQMIDDGGEGLIENLRLPDGGTAVGMYLQGDGPLTVRNCHVEGFTNNGLYASHIDAPVTVEGGLFKDNNITQVRLGSADSSIRGARIEVTRPHHGPDTDVINMRGIRIADGPGPVTVADCDIWLRGSQGTGGIVTAYSGGSLDVSDTRIYVDREYTTPNSEGDRTSWGVFIDEENGVDEGSRTFENVSITGGGRYMSGMLIRRSDNTFENLCLDQSGHGRNGIILENSSNNSLTDATIDVTDQELVLRDSSVKKANVSASGSCPGPNDEDSSDEEEPVEETKPDADESSGDEETESDTSESSEEHHGQPPEEDDTSQSNDDTDDTSQSSETDSQSSSSEGDSRDSGSGTDQNSTSDDENQCGK